MLAGCLLLELLVASFFGTNALDEGVQLNFRLIANVLSVRSNNGNYFPLCANSFKQSYADAACSRTRSTIGSYSQQPVQGRTHSIACTNTTCFSYLSTYCRIGVHVECTASLCSGDSILVGRKCVWSSKNPIDGYTQAQKFCEPFNVVSLPRSSDASRLSGMLTQTFGASATFFTSAFRRASTWQWETGEDLGQNVTGDGDGRCLALRNGAFVAVDCELHAFVLCESGRECVQSDAYAGRQNVSTKGSPCLKWSDASPNDSTLPMESWEHNFCRVLPQNHLANETIWPSCFVAHNRLETCDVQICADSFNDPQIDSNELDTCAEGFFHCDKDSRCISDKFRCDYEIDCVDGSDEHNCEDYLESYELIGPFRLVDHVIEVWTFIPHVQGCARRCRESLLLCEAFSYEPRTQTCLLTDTTHSYRALIPKSSSLYYRRRFSSKDVTFQLEDNVLMASKASTLAPVCNENVAYEKATDSLPSTVGTSTSTSTWASPPAGGLSAVGGTTPVRAPSNGTASRPRRSWKLSCLREFDCNATSTFCAPIRCSTCPEAVCGDGTCIPFDAVCDGYAHCSDAFDEKQCEGASYRLVNGSDTSGYVEALFRSRWEPVCARQLTLNDADALCDALRIGTRGLILASERRLSQGWDVACESTCSIRRSRNCASQARINCIAASNGSALCGMRKVEVNARDALKTRVARVVGGFQTAAGAFPWTAAIRMSDTKAHHCGASILDATHLITAAHCLEEDQRPSRYEVVVGDWDNNRTDGTEEVFPVQRIVFYPLYKDLFAHDIAIVELAKPGIRFNDYVQPICLPTVDFTYTAGRSCVVSGWGSMGLQYAQTLQAALIPIIDRGECVNSSQIYQSMSRSAFCAGYLDGGVDSCQGDSGGPFACRRQDGAFVLAGVISWGDGCAQKKQPGIYTMVAPYLTWIHNVVNSLE